MSSKERTILEHPPMTGWRIAFYIALAAGTLFLLLAFGGVFH